MQRILAAGILDGRAAILMISRSGGWHGTHHLSAQFCVGFPSFKDLGQRSQGGDVLLKAAFFVLTVWLVGVLGLYEVGSLVHVLLPVGLMMLMLGGLKARDATVHRDTDSRSDKR